MPFILVHVDLERDDAELILAALAERLQLFHGGSLVNDRHSLFDGYGVLLQSPPGPGLDIRPDALQLGFQGSVGVVVRLVERGQFLSDIVEFSLSFVVQLAALDVAGGKVEGCLCHVVRVRVMGGGRMGLRGVPSPSESALTIGVSR